MTNYRQQLNTLRDNLMTELEGVINGLKEPIVFLTSEQIEDCEYEECLDARDDNSGGTYEIVLVAISKDSIEVLKTEDGTCKEIGLGDLASIEDMISLYEMLKIKLEE